MSLIREGWSGRLYQIAVRVLLIIIGSSLILPLIATMLSRALRHPYDGCGNFEAWSYKYDWSDIGTFLILLMMALPPTAVVYLFGHFIRLASWSRLFAVSLIGGLLCAFALHAWGMPLTGALILAGVGVCYVNLLFLIIRRFSAPRSRQRKLRPTGKAEA